MAKKSRRVRRKGTQSQLSEAQLIQPAKVAKEAPAATQAAAAELSQQTAKADLQREYQYVVSDLKRLGILAAAILGGLLVLHLIV
jgi:hypothetical protein